MSLCLSMHAAPLLLKQEFNLIINSSWYLILELVLLPLPLWYIFTFSIFNPIMFHFILNKMEWSNKACKCSLWKGRNKANLLWVTNLFLLAWLLLPIYLPTYLYLSLFLSVDKGQRPMNYLSCTPCSCCCIFHLVYFYQSPPLCKPWYLYYYF